MDTSGFEIRDWPALRKPVMLVGLGGWGNALNVAKGTAVYLVRKTEARRFGTVITDTFFRFDDNRPTVTIRNGLMHAVHFEQGGLFAAKTPQSDRDILLLVVDEPHLCWDTFAEQVLNIATTTGVSEFISLGSMYDGVLHTEAVISGIASDAAHLRELDAFSIRPVDYHGPTAIHSILHRKACERRLKASSLWTHCPYYLEGTTHPGLVASTVETVARMLGLSIETHDLVEEWERLKKEIQDAIEENPKLQKLIGELRRAKVRGAWANRPIQGPSDDKVIRLKDFRDLS
ncbi:MAG: PAC2 family protein [Desulfobacterales bacterium]|nr:PAC2 family protein [Desulfobacterales bacterium]